MTHETTSSKCAVLVVDDDPDIREMLCEVIETGCACSAYAAENGRQALELLGTLRSAPCLILLDIMMPVMGGRELKNILAAHEVYRMIPIVAITAGPDTGLGTSGGLLRKPFAASAVLKLIQAHCAGVVHPTPPPLLSNVAALLQEQKESLIREWTARVRVDPLIPQARDLDEERLRNNVPIIVDALIASLKQTALNTERPGRTAQEIGAGEACRAHAHHRLEDHYTLGEEMRELGHLRGVLLDLCSRAGLILQGDEAKLVHGVLDEVMTTATLEMDKLTSADLRRDVEIRELFVAILGHDLRTPLTGIVLASSKLLMRNDFPDTVTRDLRRIATNAGRMHKLIEDLLDMARIRHGGLPINRRPTDLRPLCDQVIDAMVVGHPGCVIQLDSPLSVPGDWDPEWFMQLVQNLLVNAIEHGDCDAPIQMEVRLQPDIVEVAVHNFGLPIPAEMMLSIFDPFIQGEPASRRLKGLGLGLFIAMAIAEGHGGSISVTSLPGEGTSFTATLPRAA